MAGQTRRSIKTLDKLLLEIKQQLYDRCQAYLAQRITTAQEAMQAAQASANDETKSSAGDKYETGRAMMQLEMEKNSAQLAEALKLKRLLDQIRVDQQPLAAQPGSLVMTDQGNFFIAISVGQLVVEGTTYIALSAESPLGTRLRGLKTGESFQFSNKTYKIGQVW
jgi:transcription elongation GreA/GreB family factor